MIYLFLKQGIYVAFQEVWRKHATHNEFASV